MTIDTTTLTIKEARANLDAGKYTAEQLARAYVDRITAMNPDLHAYLEVFDDVVEQARAADAMIAAGESKKLTGIPIAIKDNILIKGKRVSAASKILEGYVAPYDAGVITRLKAQGAVLLGRTNMDEFALGSSTENSAYGPTKNPHDKTRVPGGTSGGSAAAVGSGLALCALGSDTGGSIRQPAAFCGVVGLKPTYGAVSRYGLIAAASSLDQIGVLAKTVDDAQVVFDGIRGYDENDSTSLPDIAVPRPRESRVIGVPRAFLMHGVDQDILDAFEASLSVMREAGCDIRDIELPSFDTALAAYYIINPAEVSTNLARFDGIRYGRSEEAATVKDVYEKTRGASFGKEVKRRVILGTFVLSSGYVDAYYRRARMLRAQLREELGRLFETIDLIALPTSPIAPFKLGEKADPVAMYAADIFTVPVNLAGIPALSVPHGRVERDGVHLPVGFQLLAPHNNEEMLFKAANLLANASSVKH